MDQRTWNLTLGFAGGLTAAALLPFVRPVVAETIRPFARVALKQGMLAWERLRAGIGIIAESVEDLVAEVRAEIEAEALAAQAAEEAAAEARDAVEFEDGVADLAQTRRARSHEAVS